VVSFTFVFCTGMIFPLGNFAEQFAITVLKSVDLATGKVTTATNSNRTELLFEDLSAIP
jgi:Cu/Ag efflux protein CusF